MELERPNGMPQVLLRAAPACRDQGGGDVVVFDDVTRLSPPSAVPPGEVARRLAHEIKNPLTDPAFAERLQFKLADSRAGGDADMLARGTQTIINQVQAMKRMVTSSATTPAAGAGTRAARPERTDREVLGLYETRRRPSPPTWPTIAAGFWAMPPVAADHS